MLDETVKESVAPELPELPPFPPAPPIAISPAPPIKAIPRVSIVGNFSGGIIFAILVRTTGSNEL